MEMSLIEILASVITIAGALFMSKADDKSLFYAFILYTFANSMYLSISLNHGMMFLFIQMLFFYTTGIKGIWSKGGSNRIKILTGLLVVQSIILILIIDNTSLSIESHINYLELIASVIAIVGSYYLTMNNVNKVWGFVGFLVADILYIKVGLDNNMIPFVVQSVFFVYTSYRGIVNSMIENKSKSQGVLA